MASSHESLVSPTRQTDGIRAACDNLPLINSAHILANDWGVYQRSVDTSGFSKNAEYCASLVIADMYAIGCTKVVSVVTDLCIIV